MLNIQSDKSSEQRIYDYFSKLNSKETMMRATMEFHLTISFKNYEETDTRQKILLFL